MHNAALAQRYAKGVVVGLKDEAYETTRFHQFCWRRGSLAVRGTRAAAEGAVIGILSSFG